MTDYIPPDTDLDAWGERSRLAGEYLPRIATAQGAERQQLICELAGKLFDSWAERRLTLVRTLEDVPRFSADQALCLSLIVMQHLLDLRLNDQENEAIDLTIAGRRQFALHKALARLRPAVDVVKTPKTFLYVFPRLDTISLSGIEIDEGIGQLEQTKAEVFETEQAAFQFYQEHLTTHLRPVYRLSLHRDTGKPFTGLRLSQYHSAPAASAGAQIGVALDFSLDQSIRCVLAEDWEFRALEMLVAQKTNHKTVRRHPEYPGLELAEALHDLESALYNQHTSLSADALRGFWSSFEVHRYLTLYALKMCRYANDYSTSVTEALDYVRRHLVDYVEDVLVPSVATDQGAEVVKGMLAEHRFQSSSREDQTTRSEGPSSAIIKGNKPNAQRHIGSQLKKLKTESNLTWKTIAKESGVSYRWLLDISGGRTPSAETRNIIRNYFSRILKRRIRF
jgi:hypothetical protein